MNRKTQPESLKTAQKDYTARILGNYFHATQELLAEHLIDKTISDIEIRMMLDSLAHEYANKIERIYG